jgi:hypothetical protein
MEESMLSQFNVVLRFASESMSPPTLNSSTGILHQPVVELVPKVHLGWMWRRLNRITAGIFAVWSIVVGATLFAVTLLTTTLSMGEEIFYLVVVRQGRSQHVRSC